MWLLFWRLFYVGGLEERFGIDRKIYSSSNKRIARLLIYIKKKLDIAFKRLCSLLWGEQTMYIYIWCFTMEYVRGEHNRVTERPDVIDRLESGGWHEQVLWQSGVSCSVFSIPETTLESNLERAKEGYRSWYRTQRWTRKPRINSFIILYLKRHHKHQSDEGIVVVVFLSHPSQHCVQW